MDKFIQLFEEYLMKAITMTEAMIAANLDEKPDLDFFTANRERLFSVIDQISLQINWAEIEKGKREELNKQVDYIKKLDEKLLVKLQEYQIEVRKDIEKTFRQKENLKGYNLNDVK
jgi:hypothetical protein